MREITNGSTTEGFTMTNSRETAKAMTKREAVAQLISDFHNKLIADNFSMMSDLDLEIAKALKIKLPKEASHA